MDVIAPTTSTSRDPAPGRLVLVQAMVNTLDVELGVDELLDLPSLASWLGERGLLAAGDVLYEGDLERTRTFREGLRVLLDEHAGEAERTAAATGVAIIDPIRTGAAGACSAPSRAASRSSAGRSALVARRTVRLAHRVEGPSGRS